MSKKSFLVELFLCCEKLVLQLLYRADFPLEILTKQAVVREEYLTV
jgi:hypothetical protein